MQNNYTDVWLSTNEALSLQHVIVTQQERILELEQEVCAARVVSTPPYDDTPTFQVTHLHYETDGENSSWRAIVTDGIDEAEGEDISRTKALRRAKQAWLDGKRYPFLGVALPYARCAVQEIV